MMAVRTAPTDAPEADGKLSLKEIIEIITNDINDIETMLAQSYAFGYRLDASEEYINSMSSWLLSNYGDIFKPYMNHQLIQKQHEDIKNTVMSNFMLNVAKNEMIDKYDGIEMELTTLQYDLDQILNGLLFGNEFIEERVESEKFYYKNMATFSS